MGIDSSVSCQTWFMSWWTMSWQLNLSNHFILHQMQFSHRTIMFSWWLINLRMIRGNESNDTCTKYCLITYRSTDLPRGNNSYRQDHLNMIRSNIDARKYFVWKIPIGLMSTLMTQGWRPPLILDDSIMLSPLLIPLTFLSVNSTTFIYVNCNGCCNGYHD